MFTGLFYRDQIADYYRANGLAEPYDQTARRKIVPETLERRVLSAFADSASLFRKTSCAVSYAHGLPDYNGHYGISELCDICPVSQLDLCRLAHRVPTAAQLHEVAKALPEADDMVVAGITQRAAVVSAWSASSHAITCSTRLTSRCTTSGTRTTRAVTDGRISDGRGRQMTGWTSMRYAVVDVEGNGQQPPDLVELAVVPIAAAHWPPAAGS